MLISINYPYPSLLGIESLHAAISTESENYRYFGKEASVKRIKAPLKKILRRRSAGVKAAKHHRDGED